MVDRKGKREREREREIGEREIEKMIEIDFW